MIRCAIYIRVSTEEQHIHGLSLDTQKQNLIDYAKQHDYEIVDIYSDGGISARKKAAKREELQRLLSDVEKGLIDIIIFTKLDRWFRNISEYYKVQDILEKNHVDWKTIYENYDTSTASGRLHINIMLSVAQDEADRTSERIKAVFDSKIKRGEVVSGSAPFGYRIENKHLVEDGVKADIVKDCFKLYLIYNSRSKVHDEILRIYGYNLYDSLLYRILHNEIYTGRYRDNYNYCPVFVSHEDFLEVQKILKSKNVRPTANAKRFYVFSGLIQCSCCNRRMVSTSATRTRKKDGVSITTNMYRCGGHASNFNCDNAKYISEMWLEKYLTEHMKEELQDYIVSIDVKNTAAPVKKNNIKRSDIIKKLNKLKDLYVNDLIDLDMYKKDYDKYNSMLTEIDLEKSKKNEPRDLTHLKKLLDMDFETVYYSLTPEERRVLWQSIIDIIRIDNNKNVKIIFK